jgi:signal peptidase
MTGESMNKTQPIYTVEKKGILHLRIRDVKFFRVIGSLISISLRLVLILAFIVTAFTVVTSNTDLLFGIRSYTVLSGSMEPTIPTGSIIYTMKNLGYNLGDVITYKVSEDKLVTHRVVEIKNNGEVLYVTKGDANAAADASAVTADKVLGKTYFFLPFIGRVSGLLKTPAGLFTVVFLPAIVIILFELWNIKKEIEKSVERRILSKLEEQRGAQTYSHVWSELLS